MTARRNGIGTPPPRDPLKEGHDAMVQLGRAIANAWIVPTLDRLAAFLRRFEK